MVFREAQLDDIPELHVIRLSVKENALSNPMRVRERDYIPFLTTKGKGWLCELNHELVGFAILDLADSNVWALFVKPGYEARGIGTQLMKILTSWFFNNDGVSLWLRTAPDTRASRFYLNAGWKPSDRKENGEIRFVLDVQGWRKQGKP
jgi:GNAT superfamily N-acetyltransferase